MLATIVGLIFGFMTGAILAGLTVMERPRSRSGIVDRAAIPARRPNRLSSARNGGRPANVACALAVQREVSVQDQGEAGPATQRRSR
jgi:hypothetical protein